ncbi:reverse transcriptase domain-containing protein [Tanacetum coccineum]
MAKPVMNKSREQNLAEPRDECNEEFEVSKELLTKLQNNTFSRRCEEDVIRHISKVLEILDLWMNDGDGNISTWEELVKKFFKKFYPLSCASNYDKMCDDDEEGHDLLEFIPWRNLKFKDHKKVDE